jgi:Zn-dependent M16 (insulinase) family peptidase
VVDPLIKKNIKVKSEDENAVYNSAGITEVPVQRRNAALSICATNYYQKDMAANKIKEKYIWNLS